MEAVEIFSCLKMAAELQQFLGYRITVKGVFWECMRWSGNSFKFSHSFVEIFLEMIHNQWNILLYKTGTPINQTLAKFLRQTIFTALKNGFLFAFEAEKRGHYLGL